jgi:hypothetical protein
MSFVSKTNERNCEKQLKENQTKNEMKWIQMCLTCAVRDVLGGRGEGK